MLDGRLARMTRLTSDFGGQLDSLCDAISFGVAPAVLMMRTVVPVLRQMGQFVQNWQLERVAWLVAAVYVACGVLRLARFNVENEPDESAHMNFRGLPIPGAAAAVTSLVLLFERLTRILPEWQDRLWLSATAIILLPAVTLGVALLMVSRFRYAHLINHYVRGKRPFSYLVRLVVIGLVVLWHPLPTVAAGTNAYALSGPVLSLWRRFRRGKPAPGRGE